MYHELKTWPRYFDLVRKGEKTFEVRKNDRSFTVGDTLVLREWDRSATPEPAYTGRVTEKVVTYMMHGGDFGIDPDFVVMAIR